MSPVKPQPSAQDSSSLGAYLARNPESKLDMRDDHLVVIKPWGDETLEIDIGDDEVADALNNVRLPPSFTAIWHADTKDFEVIWAPVAQDSEYLKRRFTAVARGQAYQCEFAAASQRLLTIAEAARPVLPPRATVHRNLLYLQRSGIEGAEWGAEGLVPTYFWVRAIDWDESVIMDFVRQLNFYMHYFDTETPLILIHETATPMPETPRPRFLLDNFPERIVIRQLESHLLSLWETVRRAPGDPRHVFLYCYQIIEFASFYYLKDDQSQQLRRILVAPETATRPDDGIRQVLDVVAEFKARDEERVVAVVRQFVDPVVIWKEIELCGAYFSAEMPFEGGFRLPPLIKSDWTLEDFKLAWLPKLPDALRQIRNALVHSRESRMVSVITPHW